MKIATLGITGMAKILINANGHVNLTIFNDNIYSETHIPKLRFTDQEIEDLRVFLNENYKMYENRVI